MFQIRLAQTREYHPRDFEHWLHTAQKSKREMWIAFKNESQKTQISSSENLEETFAGSRSIKNHISLLSPTYFARQLKGTLLPIKRYSQFEDRINKERIFPADSLISKIAATENSHFKITFKAIKDKKRERALKKCKKAHFKAERHLDQWESRGWFHFKFRKIFSPLLRLFLTKISAEKHGPEEKTESIHEREDPLSAILDKLSRPLFEVQIEMTHNFSEFLNGFTLPYLNGLKITKKPSKIILSAEELASLLTMPDTKNCAAILQSESTAYLRAPPGDPLEMNEEDRKRHLYILGKTGMGKSSTILAILKRDLQKNHAVIILDPHGDLAEDAIKTIQQNRLKDLVILDPSNLEYPLAVNPLELLPDENPSLKASATTEIFQMLAKGSWGPRLEYILRNAILTLLLNKNTSLLDLPRLLTEKDFCLKKISDIKDIELTRFWQSEFLNLDPKTRQEHIAPILNKVGPLLTSPTLRNIFGQPRGKLNFDSLFDQNKIVIIALSKGKLGEDASKMLGMIFISMIQTCLLKRANIPATERKTVAMFIDEFQNFCSPTLLTMLSESRKYGLSLTVANQFINQIPPEYQDAVLGNVGSLIAFRTNFADAEKLAPQLSLVEEDLCQLPPFQAYAKLLKNSECLPTFRFETQKIDPPHNTNLHETIKICAERFGRRRSFVEQKLEERYSKSMKKFLATIFLSIVLILPATSQIASAANSTTSNFDVFEILSSKSTDQTTGKETGESTSQDIKELAGNNERSTVAEVLLRVINILTLLIGTFAFVVLVAAGILMITSQGDQTKIDRYKNMISQAIIGLIFGFASYTIVTFVQSFFY